MRPLLCKWEFLGQEQLRGIHVGSSGCGVRWLLGGARARPRAKISSVTWGAVRGARIMLVEVLWKPQCLLGNVLTINPGLFLVSD